ncbi:MAG TPA: SUMF1/EgtB/PvdO family nonheme iron enzyme [Thermoanaerobaculia bacterium]
MTASFDVFLSHNSKDKPAVRELAEALRARGLKVWLDEWELVPGRPWQEALEEIIQSTRSAAVLVGKDGLGPWEIPEMRACLSQFVRRRIPVIPVLLSGASQEPELPLFLQEFTWVDLRGGLTEAGLDQLAWGITGKKRRQAKPKKPNPGLPEDPAFAAYRAWAAEQYRGLSLIGVGGGDVRMRFEEVYIPLRIGQNPERPDLDGPEAAKRLAEAAADLQVEEIFTAPHAAGRHALILGHPGSGKTTALLKLLHQCLKEGPESLGLAPGTLPVFLRLRRLRPDDLEQDHPLAVLLARELADVGAGALPSDLGERLWKDGRLLLLLDGLDEIAAEPLRSRVCQALDWELTGPARAVVSCRFAGYGNRVQLGERFLPLEVRPLDAGQCRLLVRLWFQEAPRALPDFPEAEARRAAERLIAALDGPSYGAQAWKVLIGTPLLLTLLCVIALRGGQMPRQRVAFYSDCLRVLLERRSRAREGEAEPAPEPPLDLDTALVVLRSLAWDLHQSGRRDDLDRVEAVDKIEQRLVGLGKPPNGFSVLDWLHRDTGVLVEAAPREYGFLHLGLQEYLTALEIASRQEELLAEVAARWREEWWHEVLLLLVGLPGRRLFAPLLRQLLALPALLEREDLLRACLEEASEVDLAPFLERLGPDEPVDRQAAVLRLLLGRSDPRLLAAASALRTSPDPSVAALVDRLVEEAGGARVAAEPGAADLVLLHHPADQADATALAAPLRRAGLRVELVGSEPPDDELFDQARGVAVLWGLAGKPPWEVKDLERCLRLFSRRGAAKLALRLPASGEPPALPPEWQTSAWLDLGPRLSPDCVAVIRRALAGEQPAAPAAEELGIPGKAFIEPITGIRFLWIPGGRFQMGGNKWPDEQPIHWVRMSPFWLGETPVTNHQYAVFLKQTGAKEPDRWRDRRFSSPDQPVVGVSWMDAMTFCRWLSQASSRHVVLPSEAQWEFAARGTDGREYPWGNKPPNEARAYFGLEDQIGQPVPVGSFPAGRGPFGNLDQAGNVWEWCRDAWDERAYAYQRRGRDGKEPLDPVVRKEEAGQDVWRVLRGGSWFYSAEYLRSACRSYYTARVRFQGAGFRVAAAPASLRS